MSLPASTAPRRSPNSWSARAPLALVGGAVLFNLIGLRAERNFTPMLNDGSVHAQMVRAATAAIEHGHLPLTTWYPYLGLGSPQFLHYQSLGAMLTGLAGVVVGPNRAFAWSLYLLVSLWPISIYIAGRLFGLSRTQSAVAAACSPFLFSSSASLFIGYEPGAYLWIGYGLWSQLFAMWFLPITWGASWRYVRDGRFRLLAVLAGTATIAAHFMTGYLALLPIPLWVILANGAWRDRLRRGAIYLVGVALCSAWVVYPLIHFGKWASQNEVLQHTGSANSYGARKVLSWLFTGNLFDWGRFPVITILFFVGIVACICTARKIDHHRGLLAVFLLSLVLFFGRPTLGPVIDLLPGSHDLFLRRFLMGVQLSALFIAGIGFVAAHDFVVANFRRSPSRFLERIPRFIGPIAAAAALVAFLAPAWQETNSYYSADSSEIAYQQQADLTAPGQEIAVVMTQLSALPPGRVYAGFPAPDWGGSFLVGQVPVFKYLSNYDFDMVGYTLRTASLMTDPEDYFDEQNAGDYAVFGVRYLVLPTNRAPVPQSTLILSSGPYRLWEVDGPGAGYVQVASTQGTITANRTNIGAATASYLDSGAPDEDLYRTVAFGGDPAASTTLSATTSIPGPPGSATSEQDDLTAGKVVADVTTTATAAVVLKVSYDPGWHVTVDGTDVTAYMVSPALVAVTVGPGNHTIVFQYDGYSYYLELFVIAALTIAALALGRGRLVRLYRAARRHIPVLRRSGHQPN